MKCLPAYAQVQTQQAGDWSDCDTWPASRRTTPLPTEDVELRHAIKLTENQNVKSLRLGSGGNLNLNGFGLGLGGGDLSLCCSNLFDSGSADGITVGEFDAVHTVGGDPTPTGSNANLIDGSRATVRSTTFTDDGYLLMSFNMP